MIKFDCATDWYVVEKQLYRRVCAVDDSRNRQQLLRILLNIRPSVTKLSKASVVARQSSSSWEYNETLADVKKQITELDEMITFAIMVGSTD